MDGHPPLDLDRLSGRAAPALGLLIVDRRAAAWRAAVAVLTVGIAALLVLCHGPVVGAVRVWAKVMANNAASLKLAQRIGLKHERSHPDYPAGHGRFEAVEFFAITAEDYFDAAY